MEEKVAIVAGATGLVGRELVNSLLASPSDWTFVYGIARRLPEEEEEEEERERYRFVQCDLLDQQQTREKLGALAGRVQVTHLFWATWASQFPLDTPDCCAQNHAMLAHALDALLPPGSLPLRHVCLQTGTKHYVNVSLHAPRLAVAGPGPGPYIEEDINNSDLTLQINSDLLSKYNFYYHIQKLLMERTSQGVVNSWSVHRPGLLFGASSCSYFNVMGSLCVYASLCRHLGMPFRFYGTRFCWEEHYIDMSDARIVAEQQIWWASLSSSSPHVDEAQGRGNCEAFNAVHASPFIWKQVWPALASKFGLQLQEMNGIGPIGWLSEETCTYSEIMRFNKDEAWDEIVSANGLRKTTIQDLANWGFLDSLFRFPGTLLAAPGKAESLGFAPPHANAITDSVLHWVDRMREMRFIPY